MVSNFDDHNETAINASFLSPTPSRLPLDPIYPPFRKWKSAAIENMPSPQPLNLYVHIPFCIQRCDFCYYKTVDVKDRPEIDGYVSALCREIELASTHFHLKEQPVVSLYFGGGTPTVLRGRQFEKILDCLRKNLSIAECEITVEADPITTKRHKLETLKNLGINRLSLGIQSFSNDILSRSGRLHTRESALEAIEIARNVADWTINIDLLSGMAGETNASWSQTVKEALSTAIDSITVYKMEAYPNTKLYDLERRTRASALPSDKQELEFMRCALDRLIEAGYMPWSYFTFTKEGKYPHKYIYNIWRGGNCYGFGVSAYGILGEWLFQNTNDLSNYVTSTTNDKLPLARGHHLSSLDRMIRDVALGMKLLSFDFATFRRRHGFCLNALCASVLEELQDNGFVTLSKEHVKHTLKGLLYGDYVAQALASSLKSKFANSADIQGQY